MWQPSETESKKLLCLTTESLTRQETRQIFLSQAGRLKTILDPKKYFVFLRSFRGQIKVKKTCNTSCMQQKLKSRSGGHKIRTHLDSLTNPTGKEADHVLLNFKGNLIKAHCWFLLKTILNLIQLYQVIWVALFPRCDVEMNKIDRNSF